VLGAAAGGGGGGGGGGPVTVTVTLGFNAPQAILNVVVTETGTLIFPTGADGPTHAGITGDDPLPHPGTGGPLYAHVRVTVPGAGSTKTLGVRVRVAGGTMGMVTDAVSPIPQETENVVVTEMGTESVPDIPGNTPPHRGFAGEALLVQPAAAAPTQESVTDPGPLNDEGTPEIESAAEAVKGIRKKGSAKTLKRIFFNICLLYASMFTN